MIRVAIAFLLTAPCFGSTVAAAAGNPLAESLRAVVEGNIEAYNRKDASATMSFVDTKSPDYASTKAATEAQFKTLDATTQLVDFAYVGHDNEFAVARVKSKTTAKPGSDFTNNVVDAMVVFHQQGGAWKLWDELVLGLTPTP
jgi:hypothetical protein